MDIDAEEAMARRFRISSPRTLTFWHYQIIGWSLMWASDVFMISLRPINTKTIGFELLESPIAFCLTLVLRQIYKRLNYRRLPMAGLIAYIGLWSICFTVIYYACLVSMYSLFVETSIGMRLLAPRVAVRWIYYLAPIFFGWGALYFGLRYWQDWDDERLRARQAIALSQRARLEMLRYQLNPHFLFNALNSLRALIEEDRTLAKNMVTELSEFLRYSLIHREPEAVPLREEISAVQHYLAIEKKRFEDKLTVSFDVESRAEEYPVLSFLLHPLVENAVKYGMKTSPLPLSLRVSAAVVNDALRLSVSNSGRWVEETVDQYNPAGTGTGLDNVRARLENAYPDQHVLTVREEDGHVHVVLEIRREESV